ncbi:uncharacterized protein YbjT (DUF2867 family) [Pontibacter ummariensis]|uniref:Uncharacterized conserved protein YbjT, contains NAD(P)-binding and DUF2867 domains n=1 Tax=Pontibacter ummariensis TaxID=1610492 RepID=A0A239B5P0_9BACT|nr:SDR family oxidoreductase [Pontibacter ummariensis]PRY16319.1 uncharacterized protein YbjT (DUF2867 family) [Pontibacter ummariensis]SNS03099.1 Uncharacterized conserved protein YbjT, contains NAD(P)-binding and DUF2867 domains [Pontibacter ummariensis]
MHKTILVTGATGTVGKEVVQHLSMVEDDVRVRAGVHSVIKGENLKRLPGVEIVEMDFNDQESMEAAFTHVEKVFLITPFTAGQVDMAKRLVDEARKKGVQHIVKLSALGADASPGIQLGRWHREIEQYIEDSGIAYTFLRPSSFMQNFINYHAESIKQEGKFYQPTGDGKVGYIDVEDIAAVATEVLLGTGHEGKAYDLTGPEALSSRKIAQILSEVTGKQVEFVDVPEAAAFDAMVSHGAQDWMANALLELYRVQRAGHSSITNDTVERLTGRPPRTFRQFAEDCKSAFV